MTVGDFIIDIVKINKEDLISLRKYMPIEEYRLVKNRKIARLCRQKRKNERGNMQDDLKMTQAENEDLKNKIKILEKQLKESEASRIYFE